MGLLGAIVFSLALVSLTQIQLCSAQGCQILSAVPVSASSIEVKWQIYPLATSYLLDVRKKNATDTAPVILVVSAGQGTDKIIQGLKPGTEYIVTLKAFNFFFVDCMTSLPVTTVPDTSQITDGWSPTSSSIALKWSAVISADYYILDVYSQATGQKLSFNFTGTSAVMKNLQSSTNYDCYITTVNQAGMGSRSKVRTITTLVRPPTNVGATQINELLARVTWQPVETVLMYNLIVQNLDQPTSKPFVRNVSDIKQDVPVSPCSTYLISVSSFSKFLIMSEPTEYKYTTNKLLPVASVTVDYTCAINSASISWTAVAGATSYVATVMAGNGTKKECTSQSTSCQITSLKCGQHYGVYVTPLSGSCKNLVNATSTTFDTAPCPPNNLMLRRECTSDVITFSWNQTSNADYYMAEAVDSKGLVQNCLTQDTSCDFTHTLCGRYYNFTVAAVTMSLTGQCNSVPSSTVGIQTAPCIAQNLLTSASCSSNILVSTWNLAEGALWYNVTAEGNFKNSSYSCSSQTNSCAIEGVNCGESLTMTITAYDNQCASPLVLGYSAETIPCTPQNVTAVKDCGADSIRVSWVMNSGAIFYVAMARDSDNTIYSCNSMGTSCTISGLKCGANYKVNVIASNFVCNSSESDMVILQTAVCPPSNLSATLNCTTNEALVSWSGAPSMNSFTAIMTDQGSGLLSCSSASTSCKVPNLKCGQLYTVKVFYYDGNCSSVPSQPIYMNSVPCGPANVRADVDCKSGNVNISWGAYSNAEGYSVVISDSNNQMSRYNTTDLKLLVDSKECGQNYTVKVMSFNRSCVSFPSEINFKEVPCVPINVVPKRTCGQKLVQVTWQASLGAKNYTVAAVDEQGNRLACASNVTSCWLDGVMCGHVYNISMVAMDDLCSSMWSPPVKLAIEPCSPSRPIVSLNCTNNSAKLTWNSSPNAVSYTGKAVSADGHNVTCKTGLTPGCELQGLHCGTEYTFTVSASDGGCQTLDSEPVIYTTAPCSVQNVSTALICSTNTLTVSWLPGPIGVNYSATAVDANGTALSCVTQGSSCTMSGLRCGQQYSVKVKPISSTCAGSSSVPEIVNAVPCVPINIQGSVDCSTNTLQASWDAAAGAALYASTVRGPGGSTTSCSTTNRSCSFSNLQCAQTYSFSVVAINDRCNSTKSVTVAAATAPCDPTNVSVSLSCLTGVAMVTWRASAGANSYTVIAEANGNVDSCNSTSTSCQLTKLQCGEVYTVTVLAGDTKCNSSILVKTNITTAPCTPVIQNYLRYCVTNFTSVSWAKDEDAVSVTVSATSNRGHSLSCSSSNTSCVLQNLLCGNTYTVQAVANGVQCTSNPTSAFQIVTAPCNTGNVEYQYSCDTGIAFVSWDEALGRNSFYVRAHSVDHEVSYNTSQGTDCSLFGLLCSHTYIVEVIAVADNCNSSVPGVTVIQTVPCAPTNVSASLLCENNTGEVSWQFSPGAVSYSVTASGRNGDVKQCTTNSSSCQLPNMDCAQTYIITVAPLSKQCRGPDSRPYNYLAGPCPPTNIRASLQCAGNVGLVSWDAALKADLYIAKTVPSVIDQNIHSCSSNGTGCSLTDLYCGETVAITVITVERGCQSQPSSPVLLKTVICPPTGLTGMTTCNNSDITVSWNISPEPGADYFIYSLEENGTVANYNAARTSRVISGLHCGDSYKFKVAARNSECTSVFSNQIETETAPCPPTNLTVRTECGTNRAILSWAPSKHAISYTATLTGSQGQVVSCSSNTTTCSSKLDCGRQYSAILVSSTATCNSSASQTLTFNSAPCLPDQVKADLNCSTNVFAVQWRGSIGNIGMYTAIAIGSDNSSATCDTVNTKCNIYNLKCGYLYSIVVTTSSVDCGTIKGSDYLMYSAPCKPGNVSVNLQCSTNKALVTWTNSGPDQYEVVTATDNRGAVTICNSSSSNCTFDQLSCGKKYIISVVGYTNSCSSEPALAKELSTAPCVPTHVSGRVDCNSGITSIMWDPALGATSYTVYARGSLGSKAECNNTDTFCDFPNLVCGQDYNITVVARTDTCVSLVSESITITTAPCPHTGMTTSLDCNTNTVLVSWTPGRGILQYVATADAFNTPDKHSCLTNSSSCNMTSLTCGESYQVRVSGQGQQCPSPSQSWDRVMAAPCPPTQLSVDFSCKSNNISLSWKASQGSVSYMAIAEDAKGQRLFCNTSNTMCQISDLLCGQDYKVYVAGVDENCIGAKSDIKVIRTAPCVPKNIKNNLDCMSGVLNITWESTGYFVRFYASVVGSSGQVSACSTDNYYCIVRNLRCEMTYNVTVMAQNEACNSSLSPINQVKTAPCPPSSFLPAVNCSTGVVSVTWMNSVPGVVYTVSAVDAAGLKYNCSGTSSGCYLSTLKCGTKYNVTITPSRNECVGSNSATQVLKTVPCVPRLSGVEIDCLSNSAWVMFDDSAGAEGYVIVTTSALGVVSKFGCNYTVGGMCALPSLMCSQNLTFTLNARDQQCTSAASNAVTAETAPCPPLNVMETVNCDNGSISVAWSAVPGAVTYTAMLEELNNGSTSCCTTSGTGCQINNLPCGLMYVVHVTAKGRTCNSTESEGYVTRTVACVPENLKASLDCSNNVASMSWNYSKGGQLYRVRAVGSNGKVNECTSTENTCDLSGLQCGQNYTASVTAEDMQCKSKPSGSVSIKTVPCTPDNTSSVMNCKANSLIVSWSESAGADSYIATLQDSNGQRTTCQGTTEGSCNVTGLGCGLVYHVSVVSSDGRCESPSTPMLHTPSVPCKARQIQAVMDCNTKTALVSWYSSDGALSYVVVATAASGRSVTCETNVTSCELGGLDCAQSYFVSVKSVGNTCSSIANMTGRLITEPCIPQHITYQYAITIGQMQWDVTEGADYYIVKAETDQGLSVSCNTSDTYCALYNMNCGQIYNVTVTANNRVCTDVSVSTEAVTIVTEPCPPNNVQTSVNCPDGQGTVSWEASWGAVGYEAKLIGRDGHQLSCRTNQTFCNIRDLHCGVVYYTTVVAVGDTQNSSPSITALLVAAPCTAGNVVANLDCYNSSAKVSWSTGQGASSYMVTAASAEGFVASCVTDGSQCDLTDLECGQTYNVTLTTISDICQIDTQPNVTFSTRPCMPMRVGVDLQCGTRTANLFWEQKDGVELYMATANSSMGVTLKCNSTNSTCLFPNLQCGKTYEFSVKAYSNMCYSELSSTVQIQTEPCQPAGLRVTGSCNNETVALSWSKADGATLYELTAAGDLGYVASFQTNETMQEADLPCGQLFTFTVKSQDDRCESALSLPKKYKTGPCIPENVECFTRCEQSLGSVSWSMSAPAEGYLAVATGQDGHTHECSTNTTTCTWKNLHCGEVYTVKVVAMEYTCVSKPSNSTTIRMAPCIPQNLKSSFNCTTKVASLNWNATATATFYIVTAETNSGHKVQLSTNDTWTFISEFLCGQEYFLSVQASDSVCTSWSSQPSALLSEPCPPTSVSSLMNCGPNIAVVLWTGSAGAKYYIATVTSEDGQSKTCASDSEQCSMPNVPCGQNHTVKVVASNDICESDPSKTNILKSVPCIPADVKVDVNCSNNQAVVSWSVSRGALSYKVMAESTRGAVSTCETKGIKCTLTNLTCGLQYSVKVSAQDNVCSSLPSPPVDLRSVPCKPKNVSVSLDCYTNSFLLDWLYAEGALAYTATAKTSSGYVSTCTSNFTYCELQDLQCGQTYDVFTVASNDQCSSPPSSTFKIDSVPCSPENVVAVQDCNSNAAQVEWKPSSGAESYIVQGFSVEGYETGCETSSRSCVLSDLMCGLTYNVSVTAVNSVCNVSQSDSKQLQAVPCVPNQVEARVVCESGAVVVSWEQAEGALSYTTFVQGSGGFASTCNSTDTSCQLDHLQCGLNYSVTVIASDDMCSSAGSSAVAIGTVPCVPQKVTAKMVCSNNTGLVSWKEDQSVFSYKVQAFGPDGHKTNCFSTKTSCKLPDMHCGELYNLTVTAQDGRCDNSNAYLNLQSVPCKPTNVKASLHCNTNSAAVTWEQASGALSYVAVGVTANGSHRVECNNTMTYCELSNLQCGKTYTVSVFGQDDSCSSVESNQTYVRTAPCPPQNVAVVSQCAEQTMVVSWSPNPDAQYFHVAAVSNTAARLYCNSSVNSCTIKNLPCGEQYNITVLSIRDSCESKPSTVVKTCSAPCVPTKPKGHLDCATNAAWVTWDQSAGATSYLSLAQAADGHSFNCTASSSPCELPDLKCGTLYTFHVTAMNEHCSSNHSTTFDLETGPCALQAISAYSDCNSDIILVEWQDTLDNPLFLVTAEADDKTVISCNSSSNSCALQNVQCGTQYRIIVSASSDKCSSLRSPPTKIKTAPCAPSNVTVVPSCVKNGAAVSWANSNVATSYQLTATGQDGHVAVCNSSVNNCSLTDLHCGQMYGLSIVAKGDNCFSYPSNYPYKTAPCPPSSLAVNMDCRTQSATLSWGKTEGAVGYFGYARSGQQEDLYCDSSSPNCTFKNLTCGSMYNFTVKTFDGTCNTSYSLPLQEGAVPCPPSYLKVRMQKIKQLYWAMISWNTVNCSDVEYAAKIRGQIGNNPQTQMFVYSYLLRRPYFELPIPCSTAFNVTVLSKNLAGFSPPSILYTGVTAPCAPQRVRYTGNTQSAVLSWDASVLATSYTVYNISGGSRVKLCNTTGLSCVLSNFDPNATEVTANNAVGESNPSQNITGPVSSRRRRDLEPVQVQPEESLEIPEELTVTVSGVSLRAKWRTVKDAAGYTVVIEEEQKAGQESEPPRVRNVEVNFYEETDFKPWTKYCVKVAAQNAVTRSIYSEPKCKVTGAL